MKNHTVEELLLRNMQQVLADCIANLRLQQPKDFFCFSPSWVHCGRTQHRAYLKYGELQILQLPGWAPMNWEFLSFSHPTIRYAVSFSNITIRYAAIPK